MSWSRREAEKETPGAASAAAATAGFSFFEREANQKGVELNSSKSGTCRWQWVE